MIPFKHASGEIWFGDCLELMRLIPDGSVDMVLCDLPYGTTACAWDSVIPFEPLWREYWRVAKLNAAIVLTAAQPFTSALVMSQVMHFKYEWIWNKVNKFTGALNANKMPMLDYENIPVFYRRQPIYNKQLRDGSYVTRRSKGYKNTDTTNHVKLKTNVGQMVNGLNPKRILDIPSNNTTKEIWHPTQKPVALFEYLIKTYTNEGATILDNCSGSGTTAIAARNTGRRSICIEKDMAYYVRSCGRVVGES